MDEDIDKISFKQICLDDRDLIESYYNILNSRSCDDCFSNLYLWKHLEPMSYVIINDILLLKSENSLFTWRFPIWKNINGLGEGGQDKDGLAERLRDVLRYMIKYSQKKDVKFRMRLVTREQFALLDQVCPGKFRFSEERDYWDYLYCQQGLAELSGRKYHSKKNHLNKFLRTNSDWSFEPITDENVEEAFQMGLEWRVENNCDEMYEKRIEMCVALNALRLLHELHMTGALLRVNGKVIAYTIGERKNDDTFVVHVEKALAGFDGAYAAINQMFVQSQMTGYKYVNREDDAGFESLRAAKLSYHPVMMVEKGTATLF